MKNSRFKLILHLGLFLVAFSFFQIPNLKAVDCGDIDQISLDLPTGFNQTQKKASSAIEVILDTSGSMGDEIGDVRKIDIVRRAFTREGSDKELPGFLMGLNMLSAVGLCTFNDWPTYGGVPIRPLLQRNPGLSLQLPTLMNAIDNSSVGGGTPIAAALKLGIAHLEKAQKISEQSQTPLQHRAIVLLTDGQPDSGTESEVKNQLNIAQKKNIQVWVIGFATGASSSITSALGDHYKSASDAKALEEVLESVRQGIEN